MDRKPASELTASEDLRAFLAAIGRPPDAAGLAAAEDVVRDGVSRALAQHEFDALVSLAMDIGRGSIPTASAPGADGFIVKRDGAPSAIRAAVEAGDMAVAASLFRAWRKGGGAHRIMRRLGEEAIFRGLPWRTAVEAMRGGQIDPEAVMAIARAEAEAVAEAVKRGPIRFKPVSLSEAARKASEARAGSPSGPASPGPTTTVIDDVGAAPPRAPRPPRPAVLRDRERSDEAYVLQVKNLEESRRAWGFAIRVLGALLCVSGLFGLPGDFAILWGAAWDVIPPDPQEFALACDWLAMGVGFVADRIGAFVKKWGRHRARSALR